MLTVLHREDQLLQRNVLKPVTAEMADTYVGKYTTPIHKALLEFLDRRLVGQKFDDQEAIKKVFVDWPKFMSTRTGISETHILAKWEAMFISTRGFICIATDSMGGDLCIGHIVTEAEAKRENYPQPKVTVRQMIVFKFYEDGIPGIGGDPYWMNSDANPVFVYPPTTERSGWGYWAPVTNQHGVLAGEEQEERVWAIACAESYREHGRSSTQAA